MLTQGGVTELNIGGAVEYSLPDNENPATLLSLGGYYRNKDALIVTGGWLHGGGWVYYYDFNTQIQVQQVRIRVNYIIHLLP